jgi:hypothetical protein
MNIAGGQRDADLGSAMFRIGQSPSATTWYLPRAQCARHAKLKELIMLLSTSLLGCCAQ